MSIELTKIGPQPGPQTQAAECDADVMFYGGSAGGGWYVNAGGIGISGQGNNGGNGQPAANHGGGGGGGAGEAGENGPTTRGGNGGNGLQYSISGSATYYAGGGSGDIYGPYGHSPGTPGLGGGGTGDNTNGGTAGAANTGGGGGAGGGAGGSGIVIIRYLTSTQVLVKGGIYVSDTGNVGIETANPEAALHVEGDIIVTGKVIGDVQFPPADYDSGWVYVNNALNKDYIFNHNLGSIPSNIMAYTANSNNPTWVRPTNLISAGVSYTSPEQFWLSADSATLRFYNGDYLIYCDANNPCPSGVVSTGSAYFRLLMWK